MNYTLTGSFLSLCFAALWAASSETALEVSSRLQKTAFFVGEPIVYEIRARYPLSVEFILDRFQAENIRMEPFEVKQLAITQETGEGFQLLTLTLELVSYEIELEPSQIPPVDLYYVRADGPRDALGESEVQVWTVPATPIAVRSTLPEELPPLRDDVSVVSLTLGFWVPLILGILGLALSVVPLARMALRRGKGEPEEATRDLSEARQNAALKIQGINWEKDSAESVEAVAQLADILRDYAGEVSGRQARALTARELEACLLATDIAASEAQQLCQLVERADFIVHSTPAAAREELLTKVRSEAAGLFRE